MNYYNEHDSYAAAWLRNLIDADVIPQGVVDERDIRDVRPVDLVGFTSCHFFAGLGGWPYALRLAGWPDSRPVWTGSCPCQPFSAAGKGLGFADERHLWPAWLWLIVQRRPDVIFGEQVDKALDWLDLVATDLEGEGYACGPVILPAAGVGAPHGRHRLWWVADSEASGLSHRGARAIQPEPCACSRVACGLAGISNVANADERIASNGDLQRSGRLLQSAEDATASRELAITGRAERGSRRAKRGGTDRGRTHVELAGSGDARIVGDTNHPGPQGWRIPAERARELFAGAPGMAGGFWSDADWIYCRDGKYRPVEPGTFPLAHGVSDRVGRLRAYGNAIVPQEAAEIVRAYAETRGLTLTSAA